MGNISKDRENKFIVEQSLIVEVDDSVICKLFKYDKFASLVTNPIIIDYLTCRYDDSSSLIETIQRIKKGAHIKPKCPLCGNPVTWIGRKRALFSTYCSNPSCYNNSNETKNKKRESLKQHSEENKQRMIDTYGVEFSSQRIDVIEKRKQTLQNKYGTTKLYEVPEIRDKIKSTVLKKTGYDSYFKVPDVRIKAYQELLNNSKTGTSKMEDNLYNYFIELGFDDVIRQYYSDEYPYPCDFYLPTLSMYIEYQGSQYHNGRAYLGTKEDIVELNNLIEKDKIYCAENNLKISQYANIAKKWADIDCRKREYAKEHNLKFLEVYSCNSKEELLFQINMLEHAWNDNVSDLLNKPIIDTDYYLDVDKLENGVGNKHDIIKYYQFNKFYENELYLYSHDPIIRRKLIQNRMKFLNKKENELTVMDIIGGFKKSGIYYGYSHFNPKWTAWFCRQFDIKTIYDPCGGWGHHILGMQNCERIYYNDINADILDGVRKMCGEINRLKDTVVFSNEDAANHDVVGVDAFFMCPPYFNMEDYGNTPFNDIEEYKKFLNNIFYIWKGNCARWFGIIIVESLMALIDEEPYAKYEINSQSLHFVKTKKDKEYFYIFKKN